MDSLLQETGDKILQETLDAILLEQQASILTALVGVFVLTLKAPLFAVGMSTAVGSFILTGINAGLVRRF